MSAKQKLHQAKLAEWAARFSEQKASGLTVRKWCELNHLSIHKYNYWKHLLKEEAVDQMLPEIVPLSLPSSLASTKNPLPHDQRMTGDMLPTDRTIRTNRTNGNIRLCIDGVALELEPSISEDFLRVLIRAVHYA